MVESIQLKKEAAELVDDGLQKRFGALFDDEQGSNARRAFVAYCRTHNLHPSDIQLLHGNNLFNRLWNMVKRQEKLIEEYRATNKFLSEQVRQLNSGRLVLPPHPAALERVATLQQLCRQKFGLGNNPRRAACRALGITAKDWKRLEKGDDISDGVLRHLEEMPDYDPPQTSTNRKRQKPIENATYAFFEKQYGHIPKPTKFGPRANMSLHELSDIGRSWFGDDWQEPLASFIGYDLYHFTQLLKGDRRFLRLSGENFLREVQAGHVRKGGPAGLQGPPHDMPNL